MTLVNIRRAKAPLSRLVVAGEEIIIAKACKPLAKLIRYEPLQIAWKRLLQRARFWSCRLQPGMPSLRRRCPAIMMIRLIGCWWHRLSWKG